MRWQGFHGGQGNFYRFNKRLQLAALLAPRYLDSRRLVAGGRDCVYVTNLSSREKMSPRLQQAAIRSSQMGRDVAEKKQAAQKGSRDRSAEHPMAKLWAFRPPGKGPTTAELEVASDVISRAKAADSSLRNADERLVCAALALRAGEFGGVPTRAAEAMGKVGSKAKHVRDWVARIEKLEQASGSTSTVNSSELLVHTGSGSRRRRRASISSRWSRFYFQSASGTASASSRRRRRRQAARRAR